MSVKVDLGGQEYTTSTAILSSPLYQYNGPHIVSITAGAVYGNGPVVRIGNGAIGPTGLLGELCSNRGLRVEWVGNTSRNTQIALQAGVVDIILTYERDAEEQAEKEGWSKTVGIFCHDHFVLAGPRSNPAKVDANTAADCFSQIAEAGALFHSRNDGSTTMHKEHELWKLSGASRGDWYTCIPGTPLQAMARAEKDGAYLLVDRGTFLTAKRRGIIPNTICYSEGEDSLMNTVMLLIRAGESRKEVLDLVAYLMSDDAQEVIHDYGREWGGLPLFSIRNQPSIPPHYHLATKYGLEANIK